MNRHRLGLVLFCSLLALVAMFAPSYDSPGFYFGDGNNLTADWLSIVLGELTTIGVTLWRGGYWTLYSAGLSLWWAIEKFTQALHNVAVVNAYDASHPIWRHMPPTTIGWGWILVFAGPIILMATAIRDFWPVWFENRRK